jgi:hypothetical protein
MHGEMTESVWAYYKVDSQSPVICPIFNIKLFLTPCSGQGETVASILIDLNGFWTYENREVLVMQESQGASEV